MKLSTKGTNAILALFNMALVYPNELISINDLSNKTNISPKYLEQIFSSLKKDNIINSKRGLHGGYSFARPTSDISVYDILSSLEGNMEPVDCLSKSICSRSEQCKTKSIWNSMHIKMINVMKELTLKSLVESYGKEYETIN